ncbi:MAG TPA: conjugal transfer protein TrbE [Stellaceae bacterium]|nr:conjugal transfer protein TrbE [Stellaceae bacterium]
MLDLREYRTRRVLLADYLPWAGLVAPGVVLNKDGALQRTSRFHGPDLDSATDAELVAVCARVNNTLKRLGSGWALFVEALRREAAGYPESRFPDPVSDLVDRERRAMFETEGAHFESECFLTFAYLPPPESAERVHRLLYDSGEKRRTDWRTQLEAFQTETDRIFGLLEGVMPEIAWLDDCETLAYLHSCVSTECHPIDVPPVPFYIDGLVTDMPLVPGVEPMLGHSHLRTLTLRGFPDQTWPGLLDEMNRLPLAYRWVARWLPLDKPAALKEIERKRRHWYAKRKGIAALLRETLWGKESPLVDSDAENQAMDADMALQELGADYVAYGLFTATVTVWDEDQDRVADKVKAIGRVLRSRGFVVAEETLNAVEAWLSSLPGQCYANLRQPPVSSLNLVHMVSLSSIWAGPERNDHLDGPPLLHARTAGSTPFRLVLHQGDVGHTLIVGPTGAGKSVLLNVLDLQFRRYDGALVFRFDKGRSSMVSILGMAGSFYELKADGEVAFQPLARIDDPGERAWAAEWVQMLLAQEGFALAPDIKEAVWSALGSLGSAPPEERTISGLAALVQHSRLKAALEPYTIDGPWGQLLDAERDDLDQARIQGFEMEELLPHANAARAVLTYLFRRIERRLDGSPALIGLDEAWALLDDPVFGPKIREWLKTLRRKNASVVFATQSLADVTDSRIAPAILESCLARVFLPNARAVEPQSRAAYERLGLNTRQIEMVARATPKRDYYFQSMRGNRLFELGLGEVTLTFAGVSQAEDLKRVEAVLAQAGRAGFAPAWLRDQHLDWAGDLIRADHNQRVDNRHASAEAFA